MANSKILNHRRPHAPVAEEFLDGANVVVLAPSCDSTGGGWRHFDRLSASADLSSSFSGVGSIGFLR